MSEQSKNIYVPKSSVKAKSFDDGSEIIKLSFEVASLGQFCKEHKNEKGYINFTISPRRETSAYGDTHSIRLDTWKPSEKTPEPAKKPAPKKVAKPVEEDSSEVPF